MKAELKYKSPVLGFPLVQSRLSGTALAFPARGVDSIPPAGVRVRREAYHISRTRISAARLAQSALSLCSSFIQPEQFSCQLFFLSHHRKAAPLPLPIPSFPPGAQSRTTFFINIVFLC